MGHMEDPSSCNSHFGYLCSLSVWDVFAASGNFLHDTRNKVERSVQPRENIRLPDSPYAQLDSREQAEQTSQTLNTKDDQEPNSSLVQHTGEHQVNQKTQSTLYSYINISSITHPLPEYNQEPTDRSKTESDIEFQDNLETYYDTDNAQGNTESELQYKRFLEPQTNMEPLHT